MFQMAATTLTRKYIFSSRQQLPEISILGQTVATTLTRKYLFYARQQPLLLHQGIGIILKRVTTSLKKASVFRPKSSSSSCKRDLYFMWKSGHHFHKEIFILAKEWPLLLQKRPVFCFKSSWHFYKGILISGQKVAATFIKRYLF